MKLAVAETPTDAGSAATLDTEYPGAHAMLDRAVP